MELIREIRSCEGSVSKGKLTQANISLLEEASLRYSLLMYVKKMGNISESCRLFGCSRKTYYKWLKSYNERGFVGLIHGGFSSITNSVTIKSEQMVLNASLENPQVSASKISEICCDNGVIINPINVQKILKYNNIGSIKDRAKYLEISILKKQHNSNKDIIKFLEKYDKRYIDRMLLSDRSLTIVQGVKRIGHLRGGKSINIQAAVNLETQLAFCQVYKGVNSFDALFFLRNKIYPVINKTKYRIDMLYTKNNNIYNDPKLPYYQYVRVSGVEHHVFQGYTAASLLFLFRAVKSSFLATYDINKMNISEIQCCMNDWLDLYNKKPIQLFPNYGTSPKERWQELYSSN